MMKFRKHPVAFRQHSFLPTATFRANLPLALLALLLLFLSPEPALAQDGYQIIAHPGIPSSALTRDEVSDLFLKKEIQWQDTTPVKPIVLKSRKVETAFCADVHGRSAGAVSKYWQRQIFIGQGTPPLDTISEEEVVRYVAKTPGAIGFVSPEANLSGQSIKTVTLR